MSLRKEEASCVVDAAAVGGLGLPRTLSSRDTMSLQLGTKSTLPPVVVQSVQRRFQATVEEDESDSRSVASGKCSSSSRCAVPPSPSPPRPHLQPPARPGGGSNHHHALTPPLSRDPSPKQRPSVHFSARNPVVLHHHRTDSSSSLASSCPEDGVLARSGTPPSLSVERRWGVLFTEHGEPTRRLGKILRGLANYIIREFEPSNSLAIPPSKLYAFYQRYKLEKELFPFHSIFDFHSRHCLRTLERLYQDLACEYHLIQDHQSTRPFIPALTPAGFQTWLTAFMQASPDAEALRLSRILGDVAFETDNPLPPPAGSKPKPEPEPEPEPERLPAHLPRHMLPRRRSERVHRDVLDALDDWRKRTGSASASEPPSPSPSSSTWSTLLYDALGRGISSSAPRTEKSYTEHKRHLSRDSSISTPADTARPRLRQRDKFTPQPDARKRDPLPSSGRKTPCRREASPERTYPDVSPARVESYRFFQGRAPGPTYDDFFREKGRISCA